MKNIIFIISLVLFVSCNSSETVVNPKEPVEEVKHRADTLMLFVASQMEPVMTPVIYADDIHFKMPEIEDYLFLFSEKCKFMCRQYQSYIPISFNYYKQGYVLMIDHTFKCRNNNGVFQEITETITYEKLVDNYINGTDSEKILKY